MKRHRLLALVLLLSVVLGSAACASSGSAFAYDAWGQMDRDTPPRVGFAVPKNISAPIVAPMQSDLTASQEPDPTPPAHTAYDFMVHHGQPLEDGHDAVEYRRFQREGEAHVDDIDGYLSRGPDEDLSVQPHSVRIHDARVGDSEGAAVHTIETLQRDLLRERPLIALRN